MKHVMENDLKGFLAQYQNSEVDFFRFPGNYGDSLIWHGTMKLLSALNIIPVSVEETSQVKNKVLFIDGGGNFVDYYDDVRKFISKKHQAYTDIVIFPHTIFGQKQVDVLSRLKGNTTIFCRETETAEFVRVHAKACKIFLWHDCAFYNAFDMPAGGTGTLNAFRSDCESVMESLPSDNIDISYDGYATKPLIEFLNCLARFEQINTDRLHVAIASALLGKSVNLYPNSYFKNEAVFNYSLRQFPDVQFHNRKPYQHDSKF